MGKCVNICELVCVVGFFGSAASAGSGYILLALISWKMCNTNKAATAAIATATSSASSTGYNLNNS